MNQKQKDNLFEIYIDFTKNEGDPTRVFKTMSGLVESIQNIDKHLAQTLNISVDTNLVLENIHSGSIRAIFRSIVEAIPDEALKKGDIKQIIGHYLHQSKHKILKWTAERDTIENREQIKKLQDDILGYAEETDLTHIPAYIPLKEEVLLADINSIQDSLRYLDSTDSVKLISEKVESPFNKELIVSDSVIKEMITKEMITTESTRILKIKKPDFLGTSKWSFKYEGYSIDAKIADDKWLNDYQNRVVEVQPGDSIKVILIEETSYGYSNDVVHVDYSIKEVKEILPAPRLIREKLLKEDDL